jgi:phage gpG-like protein
MGVVITDNSEAYLKRLNDAIDGPNGGLDAGTQFLAQKSRESMYQSGAQGIPANTPTKRQPASQPGTPPAVKSARLAGSITNARLGTNRWAFGTNVEYARIQELGGTIQHPGGTAYLSFGGRAVFVKNANAKPWMRRTQPHSITLPPRPYLRPALNNNRETLSRVVNARVRQIMKAG